MNDVFLYKERALILHNETCRIPVTPSLKGFLFYSGLVSVTKLEGSQFSFWESLELAFLLYFLASQKVSSVSCLALLLVVLLMPIGLSLEAPWRTFSTILNLLGL